MADIYFNRCERVNCIFGAMFQGFDGGVSNPPVAMSGCRAGLGEE